MNVELRHLAELHSFPAFQHLLKTLGNYRASILARMTGVSSDKKLAHLARCYQIANDMHAILASETQNAWEQLQELIEQGLAEADGSPKDPFTTQGEAWQARFPFPDPEVKPDDVDLP